MTTIPTLEEVQRIANLPEPVIRNLNITQSYFELSSAMTARLGRLANWCTFATWASKQAGQTIRRADYTVALEHFLKLKPAAVDAIELVVLLTRPTATGAEKEGVRQKIILAINPKAAMDRASDAVARGNRKVYEEIGREFARFLAACGSDTAFDAANLERFNSGLRHGSPPEGQQFLREAFTHYYQAFFETDAKAKAEWVLMANLKIGFHEQTRLQPEIAGAMVAAVGDPRASVRGLLNALFPKSGWLLYAGIRLMRLFGRPTRLDAAISRLLEHTRERLRLFLTDHLMVLGLPGERLRLGDDLRAGFPPSLRELANPELLDLLKTVDPTPDSLRETGAIDWADLPDRLHFIADLFRCYQEAPDLFNPPFGEAQAEALKAGRLPAGKL